MAFENPLTRIVIPPNGPETDDPYVDVGTARKPDGTLDNTFAGIALYSPGSLPDGFAYIVRIAESDPDTTTFVIQLYDHNNPGTAVKSVLSAVYNKVTGIQILNVGGNTDILAIGPASPNINIGPDDDSGTIDLHGAVSFTGTTDLTGVAGNWSVGGDLAVTDDITCDDITVNGNDISGSGAGTLHIGAGQPIIALGALAAFNQLFIGNSGNNTDVQIDTRSTGWNFEATTDLALAETETSATFQPITTAATHSFVKARQNTRVDSACSLTWFSTAINTGAEIGLNFNNGAGTNVTVTHAREQKSPASSRSGSTVGFAETAAATLPGGTYTVTLMWRRFVGAGTLSTDANDSASFYTREVIAA